MRPTLDLLGGGQAREAHPEYQNQTKAKMDTHEILPVDLSALLAWTATMLPHLSCRGVQFCLFLTRLTSK